MFFILYVQTNLITLRNWELSCKVTHSSLICIVFKLIKSSARSKKARLAVCELDTYCSRKVWHISVYTVVPLGIDARMRAALRGRCGWNEVGMWEAELVVSFYRRSWRGVLSPVMCRIWGLYLLESIGLGVGGGVRAIAAHSAPIASTPTAQKKRRPHSALALARRSCGARMWAWVVRVEEQVADARESGECWALHLSSRVQLTRHQVLSLRRGGHTMPLLVLMPLWLRDGVA